MAHLGARAFAEISGEVVQTTAFVFHQQKMNGYKPVFFRLIDGNEEQKAAALRANKNRFDKTVQDDFKKIPGSPIAYWVKNSGIKAFSENSLLRKICKPRVGMRTGDNARFLRLWHEVPIEKFNHRSESQSDAESSNRKWFPFLKGGEYRKWYGNLEWVVNWENDGQEIKENTLLNYPQLSMENLGWKISNESFYFKSGITWTAVSSSFFGVRYFENGCIFGTGGSCIFPKPEQADKLGSLLISKVASYFMDAVNPTLNINIEDVAVIPVLSQEIPIINSNSKSCVQIAKSDWNAYETSWGFTENPLIQRKQSALEAAFSIIPTLSSVGMQ